MLTWDARVQIIQYPMINIMFYEIDRVGALSRVTTDGDIGATVGTDFALNSVLRYDAYDANIFKSQSCNQSFPFNQ